MTETLTITDNRTGRSIEVPIRTRRYGLHKASVDMFGLTLKDFVPQVEDIISVGEFYEKAAGGQIIFT